MKELVSFLLFEMQKKNLLNISELLRMQMELYNSTGVETLNPSSLLDEGVNT